MPAPEPRTVLRGAALVLLALLAYQPALGAGFIWDDDHYVTENAALRDAAGLARIWTEPGATPQYYPLVFTTFWLEWQAFGASPLPYHLLNVLLHALSGLLLWRLVAALRPGGLAGREQEALAWCAAAAFVLHPVCVESVAWVSERKNTLSLACYLGAAHAWQRFAPAAAGLPQRPRWGWYAAALALHLAAMLAKTVTCTLPCALLVLAWWKRGRLERREVALLAPMLLVGAGLGLLTLWLERTQVGASGADWDLGGLARCLLAARIACSYLGTLALPLGLSFVYPRWEPGPGDPLGWAALLALLLALAALWRLRARLGRGPLAALLLFLGTLSPALGFFDVYPFRFSWVADHFQYHALPAALVLLVAGLARVGRGVSAERAWLRGALFALWLASLGLLARTQAETYRDAETLWRATLAENPEAWLAHNNLGRLLAERGDLVEAAAHFAEAVRLKPDLATHRLNFAWACSRLGHAAEADRQFEAALEIAADAAPLWFTYGEHLERTGRSDAAAQKFAAALRLDPVPRVRLRLARLHARAGRVSEALSVLRAPEVGEAEAHLVLARLLDEVGRPVEARAARRAARRLGGDERP